MNYRRHVDVVQHPSKRVSEVRPHVLQCQALLCNVANLAPVHRVDNRSDSDVCRDLAGLHLGFDRSHGLVQTLGDIRHQIGQVCDSGQCPGLHLEMTRGHRSRDDLLQSFGRSLRPDALEYADRLHRRGYRVRLFHALGHQRLRHRLSATDCNVASDSYGLDLLVERCARVGAAREHLESRRRVLAHLGGFDRELGHLDTRVGDASHKSLDTVRDINNRGRCQIGRCNGAE